jgi:hypothetical protein
MVLAIAVRAGLFESEDDESTAMNEIAGDWTRTDAGAVSLVIYRR